MVIILSRILILYKLVVMYNKLSTKDNIHHYSWNKHFTLQILKHHFILGQLALQFWSNTAGEQYGNIQHAKLQLLYEGKNNIAKQKNITFITRMMYTCNVIILFKILPVNQLFPLVHTTDSIKIILGLFY
jgi:hypothetical protein